LEDWFDPADASHDVSLHAFLEKQGASDPVIQLAVDTNCIDGTSAHGASALMPFQSNVRREFRRKSGRINFVGKGGNQRVPEAMAKNLKRQVMLQKTVSGIRSEADGVDVSCSDGRQYRSRFVICSVPVPVLRSLSIEPVLTGIQEQAAIIKYIEDIRPAAKDQLTPLHLHSWELDPFAGGADYMVWGPGEVTALLNSGQEGALESGERAAFEVIERL